MKYIKRTFLKMLCHYIIVVFGIFVVILIFTFFFCVHFLKIFRSSGSGSLVITEYKLQVTTDDVMYLLLRSLWSLFWSSSILLKYECYILLGT